MKEQPAKTKLSLRPSVGEFVAAGKIDTETLELLETWARQDATDDPEKLKAAQKELDEFKKAMNENRSASGERIIYEDETHRRLDEQIVHPQKIK